MKKTFNSLLHSVGISKCYTGYPFFVEAIFMTAENPSLLNGIQKNLYLPIAMHHKVSIYRVEKNLRTMRDIVLRNGGYELMEELSGQKLCRDRPLYPKEVIKIFANYVAENHIFPKDMPLSHYLIPWDSKKENTVP